MGNHNGLCSPHILLVSPKHEEISKGLLKDSKENLITEMRTAKRQSKFFVIIYQGEQETSQEEI